MASLPRRSLLVGLAAGLLVLLCAAPARAQPDTDAMRQLLHKFAEDKQIRSYFSSDGRFIPNKVGLGPSKKNNYTDVEIRLLTAAFSDDAFLAGEWSSSGGGGGAGTPAANGDPYKFLSRLQALWDEITKFLLASGIVFNPVVLRCLKLLLAMIWQFWGLLYWSLLGLGPCGGQPPLSWGQIMCILRILLPNCPPWVWGFLSMYIRLLIKYFLALTAAG